MSTDIIEQRNKIIKDLEQTFQLALDSCDYKSAIAAKNIIGKIQGLINNNDGKKNTQTLSLIELSSHDLEMLIEQAEEIKTCQTLS